MKKSISIMSLVLLASCGDQSNKSQTCSAEITDSYFEARLTINRAIVQTQNVMRHSLTEEPTRFATMSEWKSLSNTPALFSTADTLASASLKPKQKFQAAFNEFSEKTNLENCLIPLSDEEPEMVINSASLDDLASQAKLLAQALDTMGAYLKKLKELP
jgi:hypothetical protein